MELPSEVFIKYGYVKYVYMFNILTYIIMKLIKVFIYNSENTAISLKKGMNMLINGLFLMLVYALLPEESFCFIGEILVRFIKRLADNGHKVYAVLLIAALFFVFRTLFIQIQIYGSVEEPFAENEETKYQSKSSSLMESKGELKK